MKLSKDEKYHKGFSALYCYESMIPEIAENKIDGLKKTGIDDYFPMKLLLLIAIDGSASIVFYPHLDCHFWMKFLSEKSE